MKSIYNNSIGKHYTKQFIFILLFTIGCGFIKTFGQESIRGEISDKSTGLPLIGATVNVIDSNPLIGASTDLNGRFEIQDLQPGRYNLLISYVGYKSYSLSSVLVSSAEETLLFIELEEDRTQLQEVVISGNRAVGNEAAVLSARSLSAEELLRIPGSLDDPARAIRKFPGIVTSPYVTDNSISVRGNTPKAIMWRLEGVDIYNPNHFAIMGESSGAITVFSQRLLSNSDFYSGAFPADFGNALGGVFDVRFRNGNFKKYQHSVQLSFLGVDIASEGPLGKSERTSYLMNYRFSSTKLLNRFINFTVVPIFQDLSVKVNHKTKKNAQVNLFTLLGSSSSNSTAPRDTSAWGDSSYANLDRINNQRTGSAGLSYSKAINESTYFKTAAVATALEAEYLRALLNTDLISADTTMKGDELDYRLTWTAYINKNFSKKHSHRSGIIMNYMSTDVDYYRQTSIETEPGVFFNDTIRYAQGDSYLLQAYSRSQVYLNSKWQLNLGIHGMFLAITGELAVEPRLGIRFKPSKKHSFNLGYGLHSQMEPLFVHLTESYDPTTGGFRRANENLGFNKAHHLNLSYVRNINNDWRLGIEGYYQQLFNFVVGKDLPVSRVGAYDLYYASFDLNNGGTGQNYGLEVFTERRFKDGISFMFNSSIFESNYTANDGIKRSSAFNANLIVNLMMSKEWKLGKNNLISLTGSYTHTGAMYHTDIDLPASIASSYYTQQYNDPNNLRGEALNLVDMSIILKRNKAKFNSALKLQVTNLLNRKAFTAYNYNDTTKERDAVYGTGLIPVLSYRVSF
jgi:hypothetical protein